MKSVGFLILFVISLFGLSCKGQVYPPSDVKTVLPGSTATLKWIFRADPSKASLVWFFTSRRVGSKKEEKLAGKFRNNPAEIESSSLLPSAKPVLKNVNESYNGKYRFNVQATLVLENVDERYNGKYRFSVQASVGHGEAVVELYIAEKPNVTFTCLSVNEVNEGDSFTCVCKGENGNPPADVTWYKDGVQIGGTGIKEKTLTLINVDETSNGTYNCEARSHTNDSFADEKSIKLIVRQLITPTVTVNCSRVTTVNKGDYFTCECKGTGGNPPADVTWFKGKKALVTGKEKAILRLPNVKKEDNGKYRCEAKSHEEAKNVTEIELIVHFPPENTILNYDDKSLTITCNAEANPSPTFEIYVNETKLVKSDKTYTIPARNNSYAGNYTCVAVNKLGRSSSLPKYISFGVGPTTTPTSASNGLFTTDVIAGIVVGAFVLIIVVVVVVVVIRRHRSQQSDDNCSTGSDNEHSSFVNNENSEVKQ